MPSEAHAMTCAEVSDALAGVSGALDPVTGSHVETCLRCQAEVASYRRMRRLLRSMADHPVESVPGLERSISDALDVVDGRPVPRLSGAAAATIGGLAAAAGVVVLAARHRRVLRLAS